MNEFTANPAQQPSPNELISRLELMEDMVQEGRKATYNSGWIFVLWGIATVTAIVWSRHPGWGARFAWPVMVIAAWIVMLVGIRRQKRDAPATVIGRSIAAIWTALGISMGIYCMSVFASGHFDQRNFVAASATMLGAANFASAFILRWKMQFLAASIWWTAAVAAFFAAETYIWPIFGVALILAYFGFGLYLMYCEHRDRTLRNQVSLHHA